MPGLASANARQQANFSFAHHKICLWSGSLGVKMLDRSVSWLKDDPRALWIIIAIGLAVRAGLMLTLPQAPFSDGAYYLDRARELSAGLGYVEEGHPTAFWPVGYPALLAGIMMLLGPSLLGPLLLNLAAAGTTLWLVAWFGVHIGGSRLAGRIAALLYALYPAHIFYTGTPLSETVFAALAMGAFALLIARREQWLWLFAVGALFGLATLVRAQMLLFPIGAVLALKLFLPDFSWRKTVTAAAAVYFGLALVVAPWTLRNERVLGERVLVSTNGGVALYTGASPQANGGYVEWDRALWQQSGIRYEQRIARQIEVDRAFKAKARAWIAANPGRYIAMMPKKAVLLWSKDSDGFWGFGLTYPRLDTLMMPVKLANQLFYMALLVLAAICFWCGARGWLAGDEARRRLCLLWPMPAFVTLTAIVFTGQIRYHHAAMPFIAVAAGWTIAWWLSRRGGSAA